VANLDYHPVTRTKLLFSADTEIILL